MKSVFLHIFKWLFADFHFVLRLVCFPVLQLFLDVSLISSGIHCWSQNRWKKCEQYFFKFSKRCYKWQKTAEIWNVCFWRKKLKYRFVARTIFIRFSARRKSLSNTIFIMNLLKKVSWDFFYLHMKPLTIRPLLFSVSHDGILKICSVQNFVKSFINIEFFCRKNHAVNRKTKAERVYYNSPSNYKFFLHNLGFLLSAVRTIG